MVEILFLKNNSSIIYTKTIKKYFLRQIGDMTQNGDMIIGFVIYSYKDKKYIISNKPYEESSISTPYRYKNFRKILKDFLYDLYKKL